MFMLNPYLGEQNKSKHGFGGKEKVEITVKVGNFDHFTTFKIILKIFPNSFLTIFLHENDRVLWYFWDPNLKTRFGWQKYHIFKKMLGGRSYP
jgi:hypothetical protein